MKYGLIGEKLGHSYSKIIHEAIGEYAYELKEIPKEELDSFMKARDFLGINVTIPYKQDVIPYLDEIDEAAKAIGAVNTIVNRNGKLCGYNTDFYGLKALILRMGMDLKDSKVLILGTGGTSKTARAAAKSLGASEIYRVSRSSSEDAISYEEALEIHGDADYIINTTPCGMYPKEDASPINLEGFKALRGVTDVIYNPDRTKLVLNAQSLGIKGSGGLYMLVMQAVKAAELFLDKQLDLSIGEDIYKSIRAKKQNICLTGMPASGKSTVGKALAELLSMELVDTDALIEARAERTIKEIIETDGEAHFRDLESEAIREACRPGGRIISTGGGAILRKENAEELKKNGSVFFLDRPLEELVPTEDRPLGNTKEKIEKLYRDRYPIYTSCCDFKIAVKGSPEDVARDIIDKL